MAWLAGTQTEVCATELLLQRSVMFAVSVLMFKCSHDPYLHAGIRGVI